MRKEKVGKEKKEKDGRGMKRRKDRKRKEKNGKYIKKGWKINQTQKGKEEMAVGNERKVADKDEEGNKYR